MDSIARKWRDLSGHSKWKRLLDPLDIDLRRYILHYGQLAQSSYDAFNFDRTCKLGGSCKFNKENFFSKIFSEKGIDFKYSVTKFLYATCKANAYEAFFLKSIAKDAWSSESNWMGYVAVSSDECKEVLGRRDIVVVWRGTVQGSEWVKDIHLLKEPAKLIFGDDSPVEIHSGFYSVYTSESDDPNSRSYDSSAQKQVLNEIRRLVELYKNEEVSITVTGHSLGGALAIINAVDIVANGFNISNEQPKKAFPVTVFAFASPRVGNSSFAKIFSEQKDLRVLLINNVSDIVPKSLNIMDYSKVGEELEINTEESSMFWWNEIRSHYLVVYLHVIAGTQGGFKDENHVPEASKTPENKGMVEQSDGALVKDENHVPEASKTPENKGMVQQSDRALVKDENPIPEDTKEQSDGVWKMMEHYVADILPIHYRFILKMWFMFVCIIYFVLYVF